MYSLFLVCSSSFLSCNSSTDKIENTSGADEAKATGQSGVIKVVFFSFHQNNKV